MESTAKTRLKVGLFVLIGLIVAMISIFLVGGDRSLLTGRMRLFAVFDQVQGLAEGSVVSLSGINVGNIEKIDFDSITNKVTVTMVIDKSQGKKIKEDTQVEIRTQGALGDKFIYMIPGDAKGAPVKDGSVLGVAPSTDLFAMISDRSKDASKIFDIIDDVREMTRAITADGKMKAMMANMAVASEQLKEASLETRKITKGFSESGGADLGKSVRHMDSILSKIDNGQGTLGALINDPSIHERLKSMLGGSARTQAIKSLLRTSIEKGNGE